MRRKLTVVVTCTDRKSRTPLDTLRLRNLSDRVPHDRVDLWKSQLRGSPEMVPLRQLYQGVTWSQVGRLERAARTAGFTPHLLVASAGLGLREVDTKAPAYSATFAQRHPDTVPGGVEGARWWWWQLNDDRNTLSSATKCRGPMIWVLSESYSRVLAPDLEALFDRSDVLVVGGSREIPAALRVPADRGLRRVLGGTAASLNVRTAIAWVEQLDSPTLISAEARRNWDAWVRANREEDEYARQPVKDDAVVAFIDELRRGDPQVSKTRALRQMRDSGLACEQRRFGELFHLRSA